MDALKKEAGDVTLQALIIAKKIYCDIRNKCNTEKFIYSSKEHYVGTYFTLFQYEWNSDLDLLLY